MTNEEKAMAIKNILISLACNDELPIDINELDHNLLLPAFDGSKQRYITVDVLSGRRVYDKVEKKYIS